MKKDNLFIMVDHTSHRGGVNNLQVARIVTLSSTGKLNRTVKTFTSLKAQALERAKRYLKNINKKHE